MTSFTISTAEKNKPLLILNGFSYTIDRSTDKTTYWKCEFWRTVKCKGIVHTDIENTSILLESNDHNHLESALNSEIRLFQEKSRSRAGNTTGSTQRVIDHCLNDASDQMVARIPNFKYIKRNIQRQQQKNDLPPIPHDRNFTVIPLSLTITSRNDQFLQFDSGPGEDRMIIFASNDGLGILGECEEILIDGTFKITPLIFSQLYTIHGVHRNAVFPLVFALLSNKQQQSYQKLIDELRVLCPSWNPKSIMVDFEKAAINAFERTFTTTTNTISISGCFFHLQKSIQRKIQDLGLKTNYENDSKFAHDVNKLAALAFRKPVDVHQGFDDLYPS